MTLLTAKPRRVSAGEQANSQSRQRLAGSTLASAGHGPYIRAIARKPIELPPEVARAFVRDMLAYFAATDTLKKDEIAAKQLWLLKQHWTGKLKITDVREMFAQMRDQV
jgi:hypothetical protein